MAKGTRFKEPANEGKKYRLPLVLNILALLFVLTFSKAGGVIALILIAISFYLRKKRANKKNFNVAAPKANKRMSIAALALSALVVPLGIGGGQPAETNNIAATQAVVAQSQLATKNASQIEETQLAPLIAEKEESAKDKSPKTEDNNNNSEVSKSSQTQNKHQVTVSLQSTAEQKASTKQMSQNNSKQKSQETPQVQAEKKQESPKSAEVEPMSTTYEAPATNQKQSDIQSGASNNKANNTKKQVQNSVGEEDDSVTVYITDTGKKYHRSSCRFLKKSKHAITLKSAKENDYTPCSICRP